jgi:O-acetylserine/cysteine efflux transporter
VFFIRRPPVPWRPLILYGLFLGGQFALLFYAMRSDITPGLASLVIQSQVFFTIFLSVLLLGEGVQRRVVGGLALAVGGLALIAAHLDATATPAGLACVLAAGLSWGCANLVVKQAARGKRPDMLAFVAWASLFAVVPLALLSLVFEGLDAVLHSMTHARWDAWASVAWQITGNTLFGFAAWSWLLTRYESAVVSPYALLIPAFGIASSALILGEALPAWKVAAAVLVISGVAVASLSARIR